SIEAFWTVRPYWTLREGKAARAGVAFFPSVLACASGGGTEKLGDRAVLGTAGIPVVTPRISRVRILLLAPEHRRTLAPGLFLFPTPPHGRASPAWSSVGYPQSSIKNSRGRSRRRVERSDIGIWHACNATEL